MNIGTLPGRHHRYRPDHTAVVCGDKQLTFAAFDKRINRCANALLALGVGKGDKVATILGNCVELLEVYWAAAKIGAVVVPLSALLRPSGLVSLLRDSDTTVVITTEAIAESLAAHREEMPRLPAHRFLLIDASNPGHDPGDLEHYRSYHALTARTGDEDPPQVGIDRDDPYNIIYSSGTTGLPKGIVHSHYVRGMYCTLFSSAYRITPESVIIHGGSIVFNGAFLTLMPWMYLGCTYVLEPVFQPKQFIASVEANEATHAMMVPSQIVALLDEPEFTLDRVGSLEMLCSVGAPLHAEHKEALAKRLPGRFYELYGLTEGFVTILDKYDYARKPTSVGAAPAFSEMRIIDDQGNDLPVGKAGEIAGRGPLLMSGYYKRPDLTEGAIVDGWLRTGDIGYVDEDGFLFLVDRKKDLIISGGVNVYPRDIEEIIVRHPAVREASVFGVSDDKWGETPIAAVVCAPDQDVTAAALRAWINERVEAKYQRVREVLLVSDLPRGVTGKVLKRALREQYSQRSGQ